MAKANRDRRTTETKKVKVREVVVLVLEHEEAEALASVLSRVGGHPGKSRSSDVLSVYDALLGLDITGNDLDLMGSIDFTHTNQPQLAAA